MGLNTPPLNTLSSPVSTPPHQPHSTPLTEHLASPRFAALLPEGQQFLNETARFFYVHASELEVGLMDETQSLGRWVGLMDEIECLGRWLGLMGRTDG